MIAEVEKKAEEQVFSIFCADMLPLFPTILVASKYSNICWNGLVLYTKGDTPKKIDYYGRHRMSCVREVGQSVIMTLLHFTTQKRPLYFYYIFIQLIFETIKNLVFGSERWMRTEIENKIILGLVFCLHTLYDCLLFLNEKCLPGLKSLEMREWGSGLKYCSPKFGFHFLITTISRAVGVM